MDQWNSQSKVPSRSACEELYRFAKNGKVLSSPTLLAWIGTTKAQMLEVIALYNGQVPEVAQLKEVIAIAGNERPVHGEDALDGTKVLHFAVFERLPA